jgi:hypothetical protein
MKLLYPGDAPARRPLAPLAALTYTETRLQWFFEPFGDRCARGWR